MLRKEDANRIRTLADLGRTPLRFVNRQNGSGTRLLTDHLMHEFRLDPAEIAGYFVPLIEEDYFLACLKPNLDDPAVQRLRAGVGAAQLADGT